MAIDRNFSARIFEYCVLHLPRQFQSKQANKKNEAEKQKSVWKKSHENPKCVMGALFIYDIYLAYTCTVHIHIILYVFCIRLNLSHFGFFFIFWVSTLIFSPIKPPNELYFYPNLYLGVEILVSILFLAVVLVFVSGLAENEPSITAGHSVGDVKPVIRCTVKRTLYTHSPNT